MERSKKKKMKKMMMKMKKMMKKMMMMMEEEEEEEVMEEEVNKEKEREEEEEEEEIIQCELLPSEIIRDILSRLPFESLVYCRRVCKTWRTLIEDPLFFEIMHNNTTITKSSDDDDDQSLSFIILTRPDFFSYKNPELNELLYAEYYNSNIGDDDDNIQVTRPLKMLYSRGDQFPRLVLIGSSNGLICFHQNQNSSQRIYYIFNPVTGEYLNLISEYSNPRSVENGFGYDPCTKQYKLVSVHFKGSKQGEESVYALYGDVKVYTLGSGRWRDKKQVPFLFPGVSQPSVLVNGALHWVTRKKEIVSFDLADEEFRIVPSPPELVLHDIGKSDAEAFERAQYYRREKERRQKEKEVVEKEEERLQFSLDWCNPDFQVGVLGGCLYVADDGICVWVMNKYMSKDSWTKNFTIDNQVIGYRFYKPLSVLRNGALLWHRRRLGYDDDSDHPKDSKSGNIIEFHDKRMARGMRRSLYIVLYIKSFVSLKALGEKDVRYDIDSKEDKKKGRRTRGNKRKRDNASGY